MSVHACVIVTGMVGADAAKGGVGDGTSPPMSLAGRDNLRKSAPWEGAQRATVSYVRNDTVGADAAIWGVPIPVTDDLRWNAPWEGAQRATVSWDDRWNETPVCV